MKACPICLDDIPNKEQYVTKCCNQIFHIGCFHKWMEHSLSNTGYLFCPLCKAKYERRSKEMKQGLSNVFLEIIAWIISKTLTLSIVFIEIISFIISVLAVSTIISLFINYIFGIFVAVFILFTFFVFHAKDYICFSFRSAKNLFDKQEIKSLFLYQSWEYYEFTGRKV